MICFFSLFERLRKLASCYGARDVQPAVAVQEGNPWQNNLERLAKEHGSECGDASTSGAPVEEQFAQLIEQARMEKTKETLRKQQEILQNGGIRPSRAADKTVTDAKAWWGQAVVTWDPEDSKNVGFDDRRHPKKAKWFNQ